MKSAFSFVIKHKLFWIVLIFIALLAIPETRHAQADYLGPNRRVVTRETETVE